MIFGRLLRFCGSASPYPAVRCVYDYLGYQFRLPHPVRALVTEDEVLSALKELGMAGRYYGPENLLNVLQQRLGLELKVVTVDDQLWCKRMLEEGVRGAIRVSENTNRADLLVPKDLDREEYADVMYHELAHVVAAHPIPLLPEAETGRVRFWLPRKRFTSREPPFDLAACERDADLRKQLLRWCEVDADAWAEHLRAFGAYGPRFYLREKVLLRP